MRDFTESVRIPSLKMRILFRRAFREDRVKGESEKEIWKNVLEGRPQEITKNYLKVIRADLRTVFKEKKIRK